MNDVILGHLIEVAIAGVMIWVTKTVQDATGELRAFRVTLFGENGDNGLNSEVKGLKQVTARHADDLSRLSRDVAVLDERIAFHGVP